MPGLHPMELINNEDETTKKRILRPLKDVWKDISGKQTSYVNTMLKHLETNIRRLDWITRSKKWNVIYIENESWGDSLHDNDKKVINKYLQEMDIPERRFKVIKMFNGKGSIVDRLSCGHYGNKTLDLLKSKIIEEYNGLEW